jgi:hypothetical protein
MFECQPAWLKDFELTGSTGLWASSSPFLFLPSPVGWSSALSSNYQPFAPANGLLHQR